MKKLLSGLIILMVTFLLVLPGCSKDDDNDSKNSFSFQGKSYTITDAVVYKLIFSKTSGGELDIYQLYFESISGSDTAALLLAMADTSSNEFSGTYAGRDISSDEARGVFPFLLFAASGLSLPTGEAYLSGEGGSASVSLSGSTYTVNITDIPVGTYNSSYVFSSQGKVKGSYKGTISMETEDYTTKSASERQQKWMELFKQAIPR